MSLGAEGVGCELGLYWNVMWCHEVSVVSHVQWYYVSEISAGEGKMPQNHQ